MKKILSVLALFSLCIGFLVSCGGGIASGTYTTDVPMMGDIEIKGNTWKQITKIDDDNSFLIVYTYELNGDKDEISLTFDKVVYDGESETVKGLIADMEKEMENEEKKSQTVGIELGEDSFTIAYTAFTKVKYTKK